MKNIEIAPGITIGDYEKLDLTSEVFNDQWKAAIAIFEQRIRGRFLEPIQRLIDCEMKIPAKSRKYGFSIMALNCLLLETLQSFIEGKDNSNGMSKQVFVRFFAANDPFKSKIKIDSVRAEKIFYQIRCGILHQAEITGGARLRSVGPTISEMNGKIIVNRTKFSNGIAQAFDAYLKNMASDRDTGRELRKNFRVKMSHIIKNAGA